MNAGPRSFAVLGDPIDHSLSPVLYSAAFRHLGIRATYGARRVPAGREDLLARALCDLAGSGGGNVTVPHKEAAAGLVDVRLEAARRTGAVNCFWQDEDGRIAGDNTDVGGFLVAVRELEGLELSGARVLLLGAGGGARAVAAACAGVGVGRLDIHNRTRARAEAVAQAVGGHRAAAVTIERAREREYDLVVNATSLGLRSTDRLPLALTEISTRYALDLVYGAEGTAWISHARDLGIPGRDGLGMLVGQAVLSLERWFGSPGDPGELAGIMLNAARADLAG